MSSRIGVTGSMVLVALVLVMALASVLFLIVSQSSGQAQDTIKEGGEQTEQTTKDQSSGLRDSLEEGIKKASDMSKIEDMAGDGGTGGSSSTGSGGTVSSGDSSTTGGNEDSASDNSGMEGAIVIHFSPTSQVTDFDQRLSAYQNGIEEHTPFGNDCPIEYQTDSDGDESNADIVFTVSHEYPTDRTAEIVSTHIQGGDQAAGTLYAGLSQGGSQTDFGSAVHGTAVAHEVLHEYGMCEEYGEAAWRQGNEEIYKDVGGCVNPWDRPMYDADSPNSACSSQPQSGVTGAACGSPTSGGFSVMGAPRVVQSGGKLVPGDLAQNGLPDEDIGPLKSFIEDHGGVTCR